MNQRKDKRVRIKITKKTRLIKELKILFANANGLGDNITSSEVEGYTYEAHIIAMAETNNLPHIAKRYSKWILRQKQKGKNWSRYSIRSKKRYI